MAGRIQGITVEIGGDTTKLQTALKGVNTEIRNVRGREEPFMVFFQQRQ